MGSGEKATTVSTATAVKERRVPGVEGIWVFVGADMFFFAVLFVSFMLERAKAPALFESSRQALSQDIGGLNTLILLTSSWFVVLGVRAAKRGDFERVPRLLLAGIICGLAFMVSKAFEYGGKLGLGLTPLSDDFFMFYYSLTGLHLFHVIAGTVVLIYFYRRAKRGGISKDNLNNFEAGAIYWHMVDLLWIMLFPLLYLLR